jgi:hypothetical protein
VATPPIGLARQYRLADGRRVVIRPIRGEDEAAERAFLDGLSDTSKRRRFMGLARRMNGELLRYLTRIDYDRHMAFVCTAGDAIVGDAPDPATVRIAKAL